MHRLVPLVFAIALTACSTQIGRVPWRDDIDRCEQEASRSQRVQSNPQRHAFVDSCMEAKGWRASQACRETQMAGSSAFCDYRR